jgi:glycolate oxidase
MRRVGAALDDLFAKTLELGGTITGEHGVGLAKKPYLPAQAKAEGLRLMRAVKDALDPLHILNPGKIFDPDDARA